MKNYRTEIIAAAFLALLLISILMTSPWRGQSAPTPESEITPQAEVTADVLNTPDQPKADTPTLEGAFPRCAEMESGLCLVSVGIDALNGNTVFSLNIRDSDENDLFLMVSSTTTNRYECQLVDSLPNLLYCSGPFIAPGEFVTLTVYTRADERLLTGGALLISQEITPIPMGAGTPTAPAYPSYP